MEPTKILTPGIFAKNATKDYQLPKHLRYLDKKIMDAVYGDGCKRLLVTLGPRHGKLIANSCWVMAWNAGSNRPTWNRHGDLNVGDYVYHPNGHKVRVLGVTEEQPADCLVTFSDKTTVKCHENHEWTVLDQSDGQTKTVETKYLEAKLHSGFQVPSTVDPSRRAIDARSVVSVERVEPEMGKCIEVDSPDGLYCVTGSFIPTHNSTYISEHLPAWFVGSFPDKRVILSTFETQFSIGWGRKARALLEEHGDWFDVDVDRNSAAGDWRILGRKGGMKSVGRFGALTGSGADLLCIDDILKNSEEASSPVIRNKIVEWFQSTAYTRVEPGGIVIILMTRWNEMDLIGWVLSEMERGGEQWELINFPSICEEEEDILGRKRGEALWPERFDVEQLATIEKVLGPYYWSAMHQQRPAPIEGGMFKADWFCEATMDITRIGDRVRAWDLAATENDGDWTVGVLMGKHLDTGDYWIMDVKRGQWGPAERDSMILRTAKSDGPKTKIVIEQEPGSAGVSVIRNLKVMLDGYAVKGFKPTGDKEVRAQALATQMGIGRVMINGSQEWYPDYKHEMILFPNGRHDDQVDATAMAYDGIKKKKGAGVLV